MNVKTQRVLFSILAVILVAGILFAIYFTSQPSNTPDGGEVSGEVSGDTEDVGDNKGPLVNFDHESATFGDKLIFGLQTAGIGMAIVFAVLIILWGAIALVSKIVGGESAPKAAPAQKAPAAPAQPQTAEATDESELVAVCTAAIAASRGETDCAFNVISITEIK